MLTHWNRLTAHSCPASGINAASRLSSLRYSDPHPGAQTNFSHVADRHTDYTGIIAAGVDSSSRIAIGLTDGVALSLNHGHLADEHNLMHFDDALRLVSRHLTPRIIVSDANPALASSRVARALASNHGIDHIAVDHAHAHAAAVMAENDIHGRAIAIVLEHGDISELDDARALRGSELLCCSRRECQRLAHTDNIDIPRNAAPWEAAVGLIMAVAGSLRYIPTPLAAAVGSGAIIDAARRCQDARQSVAISGGRALWDGVAAITGSAAGTSRGCYSTANDLEHLASGIIAAPYPIDRENPLEIESVLDHLLDDLDSHTDPAVVAARFHASRAEAWALAASRAANARGIKQVIIAGDMTSNRLLTGLIASRLRALGLEPATHVNLSPSDSVTAVGQAVIAAALRA